jgi:tetratricopeptide (TPR) repeat protein
LLWLVLIAPLLAGAPKGGGDLEGLEAIRGKAGKIRGIDLAVGRAKMGDGRWRMAAEEFREVLRERPNYGMAKIGLGESLASLGKCNDALVYLLDVPRDKSIWTVDAASAEALCRYRVGEVSASLAAYEEAIVLGGNRDAKPWVQMTLVVSRQGDPQGAQRMTELFSRLPDNDWMVLLAYTWIAYDSGSEDLDRYLPRLESVTGPGSGPIQVQRLQIDGLRWMDLGMLDLANELFDQALNISMGHSRTSTYKAEALRREGDLASAWYYLTRPAFTTDDSYLREAIKVRVLVDRGEYSEAESLLTSFAEPFDPEVLASTWYLARARGETARAAEVSLWWNNVNPNRLRSLDKLLNVYEERP